MNTRFNATVRANRRKRDPLRNLLPTEQCWCGSQSRHGRSHLESAPGAPLSVDEPGWFDLWPNRVVADTTIQECVDQARGMPIYVPTRGDVLRPGRAFLTVLDEIGFDGPALVEPFNAEVRALAPEERVAAFAASLESVWP